MAPEQKEFNRWVIVPFAILLQLGLGSIYSWGILKPDVKVDFDINDTQALLPFAFGLLFFSIAMVFGGWWQDRVGPRKVAITGSVTLSIGYFLSALIFLLDEDTRQDFFFLLVITYGVIGGCGIGLAYVTPIACLGKWFPDIKGLINGLAVAGFGAGAFIFNIIFEYVNNGLGLMWTFLISAIVLCFLCIGGSVALKNPPEGYKVPGWEPVDTSGKKIEVRHWTPSEVFKSGSYWLTWTQFFMSAICGLMVIGNYKSYGATIDADFAEDAAAIVGGIAALFNGLGRILWGKISDNLGRRKTMMIMFSLQAVLMILFALIENKWVWVIIIQLIYFCFGGNFSLFPSQTSDYFGTKYLGMVYGMVFTAYGVAGIAGSLVATPMLEAMNDSFVGYFLMFGVLSAVACILAALTKKPAPPGEVKEAGTELDVV